MFGLLFGGLSSIILIGMALHRLDPGGWWSIVVYSACLIAMLAVRLTTTLPLSPLGAISFSGLILPPFF